MTSIELVSVSNSVLKNISLRIESSSKHVVIGPNGAGKTTLLKTIAGLRSYKGTILFNGEPVDHTPPYKRSIGYLPQSNALFPHMTVIENVMFGLLTRRYSRSDAYRVAYRVLDSLGLTSLRDKYPLRLSGGEKKLVAFARAIAFDPDILLLDEPLANLHYDYRVKILEYIGRASDKTVVITSHDLSELLYIVDKASILDNGWLKYTGSVDGFIKESSRLLDYINSLMCRVDGFVEDLLVKLDCSGLELYAPIDYRDKLSIGDRVYVVIPYDKIYLSKYMFRLGLNSFEAVVTSIDGGKIIVDVNGLKLRVYNRGYSIENLSSVYVKIGVKYIHLYSLRDR